MTLSSSHLFDLSKTIANNVNKTLHRLNNEYLTAIQQLEYWFQLEQEKILRKYQEREKALQISFEATTQDYSDQFQKKVKAYEKPPAKKSKEGAIITYLIAKFNSISADLQNQAIQSFQNQTKQIIEHGNKVIPIKPSAPVTTNVPLRSEAQSITSKPAQINAPVQQLKTKATPPKTKAKSIKPDATVKSPPTPINAPVKQVATKTIPPNSQVQPIKPDTAVKPPPVQSNAPVKQAETKSTPPKTEAQPLKPDATVKPPPAQINAPVKQVETKTALPKTEGQPIIKLDVTVKTEPAQMKTAVQQTETKTVPAKSELQLPKTTLTVRTEPGPIKPVAKTAETPISLPSNAPPTNLTTIKTDVILNTPGLRSVVTEPSKVITPPKSPAAASVPNCLQPSPPTVKTGPLSLPVLDYISITEAVSGEVAVLSKADEKNSGCVIQTIGKDLSLSNSTVQQLKISIENVQAFCWQRSCQRYILMTSETLYLYDKMKSVEIKRASISVGTGQAGTFDSFLLSRIPCWILVAASNDYVVCKTSTALLFYGIDLTKIHSTWNSRSMELERFHSVDIYGFIVGLCSPSMCRFYRV